MTAALISRMGLMAAMATMGCGTLDEQVDFRRLPADGYVTAEATEGATLLLSADDVGYFEAGIASEPPLDWEAELLILAGFRTSSGCQDFWPGEISAVYRDLLGTLHVTRRCGSGIGGTCMAIVEPYDVAVVARQDVTGDVVVDERCR